jgi:hypothetical protein
MMTELYGGARIAYIFNNIFTAKITVRGALLRVYWAS